MTKVVKENLIYLFTFSLVVLFTFWKLPQTFYQQDEWHALGHNLVGGIENIIRYTSPIKLFFAEGKPLNKTLNLLFFGFFKFDVAPVAIFSITSHLLNSVLVFFLVRRLFQKITIAFLASLFFTVNSVSHQAVTWAATAAVLPATSLILLSVLAYFKFLEKEKKGWRNLSFGLAILSLFFKETGTFLFLLIPVIFLIFGKRVTLGKLFNIHLPLFIYGGLMFTFRLTELFLTTEPAAGFISGGQNFIATVVFHLILYPLTSLFQIFIPPLDFYRLMPTLTKIQYKFLISTPLIDLVAQSVVADLVSVIGSMAILGSLMFLVNKSKEEPLKKNIVFALALFFLSFLPYAVLDRDSSYFSSRYFYIGAIGGGMIFGYFIGFLSGLNKYLKLLILGLAALYLYHHVSIVRSDINYQVNLGNERRAFLESIRKDYPKLEKNNIFYITSNKAFLADVTNPFQNGLGYTLAVWYYDSGNIPSQLLEENFLWDLGSEGYRKIDDKEFGYFQDLDKMVQVMKENNLSKDIVHAFYYDSKTRQILDNTQEIQKRLATISALRR